MKSAIIGLGVIGNVHAKVLNKMGEELVAVCDVDESRFELFPAVKGYTDYKKMIEEVQPDVVHICTPHNLHAEMVVFALNKGVNVLCEKPLCISYEQLDAVLDAEKRSCAILGVCHQNRYNPENLYLKEYLSGKTVLGGHGNVVWRRTADYYGKAEWRGTWSGEGGGVLINQALHTLDLMQWFFGMPQEVTARCDNLTLKGAIEVEDTANLVCTGGPVDFTFYATNGAPCYFPVSVMVKTEDENVQVIPNKFISSENNVDFKKEGECFGKSCYGSGHEGLVRDFYDCIKSGRKFTIDGVEASKVVKIILAAYKSNGKKVKI